MVVVLQGDSLKQVLKNDVIIPARLILAMDIRVGPANGAWVEVIMSEF